MEEIDTGKLRLMIKEEIQAMSGKFVTMDTLQGIVQTQVNAAITPIIQEMQTTLQTIGNKIANIEQLIAALGEQSRNQGEWMRAIKDEQKRIDTNQDSIERDIAQVRLEQERQLASHGKLAEDIFGDPNRQATGSLLEHLDNRFAILTKQNQEILGAVQSSIIRLEAVEKVAADNRQFRIRYERIERTALQLIPKAGKRLWSGLTDDWVVKWAVRIGIGGGLGVIWAILERMQ